MPSPERYVRSRRITNAVLMASLGFLAYLDYAAALGRSLISFDVDAIVLSKRVAHEKHPGLDDAHLLTLRMKDGVTTTFEVDAPVFAAVEIGDRIEKGRDERRLRVNASSVDLEPSRDAKAMKILIALFIAPAAIAVGIRNWIRESDA